MSDQQDAIKHAAPLSNQRLIRSTMVVMVGFLLTKLVSLGQVFLIADKFGASSEYDAFVLANSVPENIIKFIGVGALSVAFIPFFSGLLNREDPEGAWRLASQLFNTLLVVTVTVSVLVFVIAPWLVEVVVAPGFDEQAQLELTVNNMRILLLSTIIFTLSSLLTGVLNGHNHFFLTVMAPIFFDLGLLFGVIFFTDSMGVYGLAWGTVLGALLHFSIQIPGLFMFQARWYPALGWRDKELRSVITLMIPRMLASFVFAVNFIFIGRIASQLGEGAPSAFNWGLRIMDIPEALIGTALGFVIFPTLAALTELGEVDERRRVFSQAVRFILLATIPAAAGMILIGKPAVDILFADPDEAALVYAVVQVMAFAMVLQSVHEVVARAFYAQKDTIRPLIFSVAGMVVTIIVLYTFYFIYDASDSIPLAGPLGVGITGLGYLAAFITELSLLTIVLRRQWQDIDGQNILDTIGRTLAATLIMAVPVYLVDAFLATNVFTEGGRVAGLIRAGVGGAVGAGVFIASAILFNIEEVKQLPALLRRRKRKQQEATSAA
ncbi:MAG: murein biosynthesis integral membrane protein MurJ [Chloroflexi bacterium]|nr:murein biosynthesis integral membrane protein MurJ [Chloroflexota bacterium]